jgi:predicted RNase H-like nuclease (RuvC/YqgF family)
MISKNFWREVSHEKDSPRNELKELKELNSEFREEKEGLESEIEEFGFEMRKEKTQRRELRRFLQEDTIELKCNFLWKQC